MAMSQHWGYFLEVPRIRSIVFFGSIPGLYWGFLNCTKYSDVKRPQSEIKPN